METFSSVKGVDAIVSTSKKSVEVLNSVCKLPLQRLAVYNIEQRYEIKTTLEFPEKLETCFLRAAAIENIDECNNL